MQLLPGIEKGGLSMERYFCRDKKDYCDKELACRDCEFAKGSGIINGVYVEDVLSTLFGDDYNLDRLKELVKADREGRCVVLPCKPGDTVRFNGNPRSKLEVVDAICIYANGRITYNFHTTGMMTRYVDEWDEDDADNYCPVNIAMKEREENDCT